MNKITHINQVIKEYFELNKSLNKIPAKDLMPWFIRDGIFPKDEKNGLPIRKILRQLDAKKQLSDIPFVLAERKAQNTNWFFVRNMKSINQPIEKLATPKKSLQKPPSSLKTNDRDEHYIIDLCDDLIGLTGSRQHRFNFLLGDSGTKLPVDVYYEALKLVIEFNEQQHSKAVKHFDKPDKLTVSGVHRGEQRKIYDLRKRTVLPQNGINVLDIHYHDFECGSNGKIKRNKTSDIEILKNILKEYLKSKK